MKVYLRCSECRAASPSGADKNQAAWAAYLAAWDTQDIAASLCPRCVADRQRCPFYGFVGVEYDKFEFRCKLPIHHAGECQL